MKLTTRQKISLISIVSNIFLIGFTLGVYTFFNQYLLQSNDTKNILIEAEEIVTQHLSIVDGGIKYVKNETQLTIEQDLLTDRLSAKIYNKDFQSIGSFGVFENTLLTTSQKSELTTRAKESCSRLKYSYINSFELTKNDYKLILYPIIQTGICHGVVIVAIDQTPVKELGNLTLTISIAALALAVLFNLIAARFIATAILAPLLPLKRQMQKINIEVEAEKLESPGIPSDEVSQLIDDFNKMATRVNEGVTKQKSFIMDASHELKTPIARALTDLDIAKMSLPKTSKQAENAINQAQDDLKSVAEIIETLLQAARLKKVALHLTPLHLRTIIVHEVEALREQYTDSNIEVDLQIDKEMILADRQVFTLILRNCLVNAFKYNIKSGLIKITTEQVGKTYTIVLLNTTAGSGQKLISNESYKLGFNIIKNLCAVAHYGFTSESSKGNYVVTISDIPATVSPVQNL